MMGVTLLLPQNFNSHAHVERDHFRLYQLLILADFNSHAHVERDEPWHTEDHRAYRHFNSHAHVERDLDCGTLAVDYNHFNSHAHVERDTQCNHLQKFT